MMRHSPKNGFLVFAALFALILPSTVSAGDEDKVREALENLAEASGYSWTETSETKSSMAWGRGGPSVTEGKAAKDGTVYLVTKLKDGKVEAIIQGGQAVIKSKKGWKSAEALTESTGRGGLGGGRGRQRDPVVTMAWRSRYFRSPQITALDLLEQVKNLKSEGDGVYSGTLDDDAVRSMFLRGRRGRRGGGSGQGSNNGNSGNSQGGMDFEISETKGAAKFVIKNGIIQKIEFSIDTVITSQWGDMDMSRSATVEFKKIGKTKVKIPSGAKKLLK